MISKFSIILSLATLLIFSGCQKDEEVTPEPENSEASAIPEFFKTEGADPTFKEIAGFLQQVSRPKDLAFQTLPDRQNELWVLNFGTYNSGGSTVLIANPGKSNQTNNYLKDGNSWHFMALPTAIAFADNGNWATSSSILDANRQGGSFTGPSLWPGDLNIYTRVGNPPVSGVNGSHLDMLHQSPQSMGICHWKEHEFFVFDGFHGHLTYYDFATPHYPGGSDHDDGKVIHYPEISLAKSNDEFLPGHMEIDEEKKWLYVVDTERKRVVRVDVNTGNFNANASTRRMHGEPLAQYGEMNNVTWEIFADEGLTNPCGLAINGDRIFVSDNGTKEIVCFDANSGEQLGRIEVQAEDIMGIEVGPEGNLWYVDYTTSKVYKVVPQ